MKILRMVLGVAAIFSTCGCCTNRHLLEPGVDKDAGFKGTNDPYRAGCCDEPDCAWRPGSQGQPPARPASASSPDPSWASWHA